MRKIKFRAWCKNLKRIVHVRTIEYIEDYDRSKMIIFRRLESVAIRYNNEDDCIQDEYRDSKSVELMQFTGLLDKNGEEIFEGDILEIKNYEKGFGWTTRKAFVFFEDGCFKIDNNNYWNPLVAHVIGEDTDYKGWTAKVIGNIYENPELIKDGGEKNE